MPVNVTDAGPFEKLIAFSVSEEEIDAAKASTARRISKDLKIAGFRPGKAPQSIVERTVGSARLRAEAIDDLLPARVAVVLDESSLEPAVTPALESLDEGESGVDVTVRVTLWPSLENVPDHRDRQVTVMSPDVTDEDLSTQIDRMRQQFGELEDRDGPANEGDFVTVDISATADGEGVEEASASQLIYEIGSEGFLDGIDEALDGVEKGETRSFDGVLPEGFGEAAGKEVTFQLAVTDVRRLVLPELTDEWVAEVSEFASVSELEVNLEERMSGMKREAASRDFRVKALDELVEQIDIELPEALVRSEMEDIVHRFVHRLERDDIELSDYLDASGIDQETFIADVRSQADQGIRTRLLLEAIASKEGLEVTEEEMVSVVSAIFPGQDLETVRAQIKASGGEQSITGDILRNKALEVVMSQATPVDEDGEPVELDVEPGASAIPPGIPAGDPLGDTANEVAVAVEDVGEGVLPAGIPLDEPQQIVEDDEADGSVSQ